MSTKKQRYWFLESKEGKDAKKLYPVAGQTLDGEPVRTDTVCQADRDKRDHYPAGTVFCTSDLVDEGFRYSATDIFPMNADGDLLPQDAAAPVNQAAYDAYNGLLGTGGPVQREAYPAEPTLIDTLRAKNPCPTVAGDGFWVDPDNWDTLLCNCHDRENTMLVGPSGTGKTELVLLLGKRLGLPVKVYDMGAMHDPMTQLLGTHRLVEKDGNTVSAFEYAQFVRDIQQPGIILLDELSRAPLMTDNILFPCLDSRRELAVEMAGENEARRVKVHPDVIFIATANVGAEYTGTMSLDRALVSRFFPVELDWMPEDVESDLLAKRFRIRRDDARMITKKANKIRKMYRDGEISTEVSVRDTVRAARQVSFGRNRLCAMEKVFLPMFSLEERPQVKRLFMTS